MVCFYIDLIRAHPFKAIAILLFFIIIVPLQLDKQEREVADLKAFRALQHNNSLDAQEKISELKNGLIEIELYLANQKRELDIIQNERNKAQEILSKGEAEVDLLFSGYQKHIKSGTWWDNSVGFVLGVLASLFASLINDGIKKKKADENLTH